MSDPASVLVLAPNWLGDAVMALPAMTDIRGAFPSSTLTVAARRGVAGVFALVPFVDQFVPLRWSGRWWQRRLFEADVAQIREIGAELAILLPNSFASAWLVQRAMVPDRWGYAADLRRRLLSRAVPRPSGSMHQGAYYQYLTRELGIDSGPLEPAVTVPAPLVASARELLVSRGWDGARPLVVFAPGAAYGTAKRWIPAHVAGLAAALVRGRDATCVLVGSAGDRETTAGIAGAVEEAARPHVIDLAGATSIELLAAVLGAARVCVSNDSGAMHLAAAAGTAVVALFGPTNEYETAPLARDGRPAAVLMHQVWCRPCMLRECPIDHRCMKGIPPARVYDEVTRLMESARA
ncbi:MAG: lipopolysaccharide heptosyltransferase II [Acidobacteria bacterium]|nr:lipopolysaccharide heptosyltransferase II [Acidobacteriota bacterium]